MLRQARRQGAFDFTIRFAMRIELLPDRAMNFQVGNGTKLRRGPFLLQPQSKCRLFPRDAWGAPLWAYRDPVCDRTGTNHSPCPAIRCTVSAVRGLLLAP